MLEIQQALAGAESPNGSHPEEMKNGSIHLVGRLACFSARIHRPSAQHCNPARPQPPTQTSGTAIRLSATAEISPANHRGFCSAFRGPKARKVGLSEPTKNSHQPETSGAIGGTGTGHRLTWPCPPRRWLLPHARAARLAFASPPTWRTGAQTPGPAKSVLGGNLGVGQK